jgi:uncharacterized protein
VTLYLDASALVKRYLAEEGSAQVETWITSADGVAMSRIGFVEVYRAIVIAAPADVSQALDEFREDWRALTVIELRDEVARRAGILASSLGLRSLDAIHLASAELLLGHDMQLATWDRRLWTAAHVLGLGVLPEVAP